MLNELYATAVALKSQNIEIENWHPMYKNLPQNTYRIWFDGNIHNIEPMDETLCDDCRKYTDDKKSYPCLNIVALYKHTDEIKNYCSTLEKNEPPDPVKLRALCIEDKWTQNVIKKINLSLSYNIPNITDAPNETVISRLFRHTKNLSAEKFRDLLENYIWENFDKDVETSKHILYGGKNNIPVFLDLHGYREWFTYPVSNIHTTNAINDQLLKDMYEEDEKRRKSTIGLIDAFGAPYAPVNAPFPEARVPKSFYISLRCMFGQNYNLRRYKIADSESFLVSVDSRMKAKAALEWLLSRQNYRKTWNEVYKGTVLIVAPDRMKTGFEFTNLIAKPAPPAFIAKNVDDYEETIFISTAEKLIKALSAVKPEERPENLQIFALQHYGDKHKNKTAKVIYAKSYTTDNLIKSAEIWREACQNFPPIRGCKPRIPYPDQFINNANTVWQQNGEKLQYSKKPTTMSFTEGMDIFLNFHSPDLIQRILREIVVHWFGLVLNSSKISKIKIEQKETDKKNTKDDKTNKKQITDNGRYNLANLSALLGCLLYKSNIKKEDYMKNEAFLLGQLLQASDTLHAFYCEAVRDNDIPPQLAGAEVFHVASDMPVQALSLLGQRMTPYLSWAKQYKYKKGDKSNRVGAVIWCQNLYTHLATQLVPLIQNGKRFNEFEKAQLFLGYLAKLPKQDEIKNENIETEKSA